MLHLNFLNIRMLIAVLATMFGFACFSCATLAAKAEKNTTTAQDESNDEETESDETATTESKPQVTDNNSSKLGPQPDNKQPNNKSVQGSTTSVPKPAENENKDLIINTELDGTRDDVSVNTNEKSELQLPDLTRTYGFDIRPDVQMVAKEPVTDKEKLNALKSKVTKNLEKQSGNTKYGLQQYTKPTGTGTQKYGFGMSRKLEDAKKDSLTVHGSGVIYDREKKNKNYYIGVDTKAPEVSAKEIETESPYMYIGIKLRW